MRGSPLLQAIFVVVACLLAGVPVWRLTRPAAAAVSSFAATPAAKTAPLELEVDFAPPPVDFSIRNLDQTVLAGRGPQAHFNAHWEAASPAEGVDLVVQAQWAAESRAAMRVVARFPDGRRVEKSFWSGANGTLADVFTLPGN